eukprot:6760559-Lingulodinium_polyedra.AAC.1
MTEGAAPATLEPYVCCGTAPWMHIALAARRVVLVLPKTAALRALLMALEIRPFILGLKRWRPGPRSMPRSGTTAGVSM